MILSTWFYQDIWFIKDIWRCWGWLSCKLDWNSYIISIVKTASKDIEALIRLVKFLSPEVALYFDKSTIWPCMEYCCHVCASALSCYLDFLDKLHKRIWNIIGPLVKPWLLFKIAITLIYIFFTYIFIGITLVGVHLNWLNWFHLLILEGGLLVILIDCLIILSPFLDVTKMSMLTVSFVTQLDSGILCL